MCKKIIWLTIGMIVAPQGLKGEVRVNPSTDFPDRFLNPGNRWLQKNNENPRTLIGWFYKILQSQTTSELFMYPYEYLTSKVIFF